MLFSYNFHWIYPAFSLIEIDLCIEFDSDDRVFAFHLMPILLKRCGNNCQNYYSWQNTLLAKCRCAMAIQSVFELGSINGKSSENPSIKYRNTSTSNPLSVCVYVFVVLRLNIVESTPFATSQCVTRVLGGFYKLKWNETAFYINLWENHLSKQYSLYSFSRSHKCNSTAYAAANRLSKFGFVRFRFARPFFLLFLSLFLSIFFPPVSCNFIEIYREIHQIRETRNRRKKKHESSRYFVCVFYKFCLHIWNMRVV